jgi:WD40 repeat protein
MDTGTTRINPDWLNPDVLIEFIDDLRESGYKIGISQYIAAQDLILALTVQGEILDRPERLKTLLGPIFCSSPAEQEDFQQRFNSWIEFIKHANRQTERADEKAKALSEEFGRIKWRLRQLILVLIVIILGGIFLPILLEYFKKDNTTQNLPSSATPSATPPATILATPSATPSATPPATIPATPSATIPATPSATSSATIPATPSATSSATIPATPSAIPSATPPATITATPSTTLSPVRRNSDFIFNWQTSLSFLLFTLGIAFLIWRLWWLWRAHLFLQRRGTTQQPELQKISIHNFEQNLFPTTLFIQIAQSLRHRIRVPSHELDVDRTIESSLRQGGWLVPIYASRQLLPEYIFLVDRTSYRDHQAKFIEEIIDRLRHNGVFITSYYFDGDPRICFPGDEVSSPQRLREIAAKYPQHRLIIVSDTKNLFSTNTGELYSWTSQLATWCDRAILTPKPVENWDYQELHLAQQFIVLPATPEGVQVLGKVLNQGTVTFSFSIDNQIPLPESLRARPHYWIDRNPPPIEQIDAMLISLREYLGKDNFYWLCACAIFPELQWNITIYLGNVLKAKDGVPILGVDSLTNLARLPWFRYGYIPDWLRTRLISSLSHDQEKTIRAVLQDLLITSVQGATGKLQLEVAKSHHNLLSNLANPILHLLSKNSSEDSPLRDYMFLGFMMNQSKLALQVPDTLSRLLQKEKRFRWLSGIGAAFAIAFLGGFYWGLFRPTPPQSNQDTGKPFTQGNRVPLQPPKQSPVAIQGQGPSLRTIGANLAIIRAIAVSPDGQMIASGNDSGEVQFWDLRTGKLLVTTSGSSGQIQSVAFNSAGTTLASADVSENGGIRIWDLNGKLISTFVNSGRAYSLAFNPDGQTIISGHGGGVIKIWKFDGTLVRSLKAHTGNVVSIAISRDGKSFASRSFVSISSNADQDIKLWNSTTGDLIRTFTAGEAGGVNSLAISPDGSTLAGYLSEKVEAVRLWSLRTGEVTETLNVGIARPHAVAFNTDGQTLAVGGFADQVQIWNLSTQKKLQALTSGNPGNQTYSLAFTPDGQNLVSAGSYGFIMVWTNLVTHSK